ncbi:hypothetical protein AB6A23_08535 [Paenibacillus tarimensis]
MLGVIIFLQIVIILLLLKIILRLPPMRDYTQEMVERALENDRANREKRNADRLDG